MIEFGDPRLPPRFWAKVEVVDGSLDTPCWVWTAATQGNGKYSKFYWNKRVTSGHAVSYSVLVGDMPEGLEHDHLCGIKLCVHPLHLEPQTHAANMRRGGPTRGERRVTCGNGHIVTVENTYVWNGQRHCRDCRRTVGRNRGYQGYRRPKART